VTTPAPGPGERQPKETAVAFEAFRTYLELGPSRSTASAAQVLGKSKTLMDRWSSRWRWVERVREVESSQAAKVDAEVTAERVRVAKRQAQEAQLHATATTLAAAELVQRVQKARQEGVDPFADVPTADLVRLQASAARAHNRSVITERLARGMTTEQAGQTIPREQAAEMAARLTDAELDARLGTVDELSQARERRRRQDEDAASG
jgi:hypothetical protein